MQRMCPKERRDVIMEEIKLTHLEMEVYRAQFTMVLNLHMKILECGDRLCFPLVCLVWI